MEGLKQTTHMHGPIISCLQGTYLTNKDTHRLKMKGWKKIPVHYFFKSSLFLRDLSYFYDFSSPSFLHSCSWKPSNLLIILLLCFMLTVYSTKGLVSYEVCNRTAGVNRHLWVSGVWWADFPLSLWFFPQSSLDSSHAMLPRTVMNT